MAVRKYSRKTDDAKSVGAGYVVADFACKDKSYDDVLVDEDLVIAIGELNEHFNGKAKITSAYRPRPYNESIDGAKNSQHIYGRAADLGISGVSQVELARQAERMELGGIGVYASGNAHIDTRDGKSRWWQKVKGGEYLNVKGFGGVPVTLVKGDIGPAVELLCEALGVSKTSTFDAALKMVVMAYQAAHGLEADGVVGMKTWDSLGTFKEEVEEPVIPDIPFEPVKVPEPYFATCGGRDVNVRAGRSKESDSLGRLNRGDNMLALPSVDSWCEVAAEISGKLITGFMTEQYVIKA